MSSRSTIRVLAILVGLATALGGRAPLTSREAVAADEHYSTHGVVKSFGPKRAYVNIAHEKIPGYMEAMTMSFEPRTADQLGGVDVGARVAFTFTASGDGHRFLDRITKE
jgi:Cu/Ag efflux protein CusF